MTEQKKRRKRRTGVRTAAQRAATYRLKAQAKGLMTRLEGFDSLVLDYIEATGLSQTRFSFEATGSVDFVRLLKEKRDFRKGTVLRVLRYMAGQYAPDPLA